MMNSSQVTLRYLTLSDKQAFLSALDSGWEESFDFVHYFDSLCQKDFETYVQIAPGFAKGEGIPNEHVACTFLFAFNQKEEIVGRVSIRHELTDFLREVGGHIGYGVVPRFRRQGYATEILKKSLEYVEEELEGIKRALVTCDEDNTGSRKTIERNGGELENIVIQNGIRKMRFWIDINIEGNDEK